MNWINDISNYEDLPKNGVWVSIQNSKADDYNNHSALTTRDRVLVFATREQANHFINHWDSQSMNDYRQACLKQDYKFWVIDKTPNGYYADDIRMSEDWKPFSWSVEV